MIKVLYKKDDYIDKAVKLIDKFNEINGFCFNIKIELDFTIDELAYYLDGSNSIIINPLNIDPQIINFGYGFPLSLHSNLTTLIIHEFGHYIDDRFSIEDEYVYYCAENGRLRITPYINDENLISEEIAEIIQIYIINPMLLKSVDLERYKWFSEYFKSPTPCTENKLKMFWESWDEETINECAYRYHITNDDGFVFGAEPKLYTKEETTKYIERDLRRRMNE